MDSITSGYPERVVSETTTLVTRYKASRDPDSPQSALNLWKTVQNEPLSRFAKSGETSISKDQCLKPELVTVAALVIALKVHSQFEGVSKVLERLTKPASHSAVVAAERHLLEAIDYDLV